MYSLNDLITQEQKERIPESEMSVVYDSNDRVLFGDSMAKGKVRFFYLSAEKMTTGRPFIIKSSVLYDGKGNSDLPSDAIIKTWQELKIMFPDNEFGD